MPAPRDRAGAIRERAAAAHFPLDVCLTGRSVEGRDLLAGSPKADARGRQGGLWKPQPNRRVQVLVTAQKRIQG